MSAPATLAALEAQETAPPPMPATVEATGLAPDRLEQLLTKTLYVGEATGLVLADRLRLPYGAIEPLGVRDMRPQLPGRRVQIPVEDVFQHPGRVGAREQRMHRCTCRLAASQAFAPSTMDTA